MPKGWGFRIFLGLVVVSGAFLMKHYEDIIKEKFSIAEITVSEVLIALGVLLFIGVLLWIIIITLKNLIQKFRNPKNS